ncbi:26748_t:CDS:2, partial [Gigaspora margarita]
MKENISINAGKYNMWKNDILVLKITIIYFGNDLKECYANWPWPIDKAVLNNAFADHHESIGSVDTTKRMRLSLLEINEDLKNLLCETDFIYGYPYIDVWLQNI